MQSPLTRKAVEKLRFSDFIEQLRSITSKQASCYIIMDETISQTQLLFIITFILRLLFKDS